MDFYSCIYLDLHGLGCTVSRTRSMCCAPLSCLAFPLGIYEAQMYVPDHRRRQGWESCTDENWPVLANKFSQHGVVNEHFRNL